MDLDQVMRLFGTVITAMFLASCSHTTGATPKAAPVLSTLVEEIVDQSASGKNDLVILRNGTRWEDVGMSLDFLGEIHSAVGDHAMIFSGTGCHHCVDGPNVLVRALNGGKVFTLPYPDGPVQKNYPAKVRQPPQQYWLYFGRCESPSEDIVLSYRLKPGQKQGVREVLRFGVSGLIEMRKVANREDVEKFKPPGGCHTLPSKYALEP